MVDYNKLRKFPPYNKFNKELLDISNKSSKIHNKIRSIGKGITEEEYNNYKFKITGLGQDLDELSKKIESTQLLNQPIDIINTPKYKFPIWVKGTGYIQTTPSIGETFDSVIGRVKEVIKGAKRLLERFFAPYTVVNGRLYAYRQSSIKKHTPDRQIEAICYYITKEKDIDIIRRKAYNLIKCFLKSHSIKNYGFLTNIHDTAKVIHTLFDGYEGNKSLGKTANSEKWHISFGIKTDRNLVDKYMIDKKKEFCKYNFKLISYTGAVKLFTPLSGISNTSVPLKASFNAKIDDSIMIICKLIRNNLVVG